MERRWVVHPGVATFEGRVAGDKAWEVRVAMEVNKEEPMLYNRKWFCEWEKRMIERR